MDKVERDRIEARLPPDRKFKMPPQMTNAMRGAANDSFCKSYIANNGKIDWEDVCRIFCAAFEAA